MTRLNRLAELIARVAAARQGDTLILVPGLLPRKDFDRVLAGLPAGRLILQVIRWEFDPAENPTRFIVSGHCREAAYPIWPLLDGQQQFERLTIRISDEGGHDPMRIDFVFEGGLTTRMGRLATRGSLTASGALRLDVPPTATRYPLLELAYLASDELLVDLLPPLPASFDLLPLRSLTVEVGLGDDDPATVSFDAALETDWDLLPSLLTLHKVGVRARATYTPDENAEAGYSVRSEGTVYGLSKVCGKEVIALAFFQPQTGILFHLGAPRGEVLPGLPELADFVGGQGSGRALKEALQQIGITTVGVSDLQLQLGFDPIALRSLSMGTLVSFREWQFQGRVTLPNVLIEAHLSSAQPPSLKEIAKALLGNALPDWMPHVRVAELGVIAAPLEPAFMVSGTLRDVWKAAIGPVTLAINHVHFRLGYEKAGLFGSIRADLDFLGAALSVSASAGVEWRFTGEILEGEPVSVNRMVAKMGEVFNLPIVPDLPEVAVERLLFDWVPGKRIALSGAASLEIPLPGDEKLSFGIDLDLAWEKSFAGSITGFVNYKALRFRLGLELGKTATFSGGLLKGHEPRLGELIESVFPAAGPVPGGFGSLILKKAEFDWTPGTGAFGIHLKVEADDRPEPERTFAIGDARLRIDHFEFLIKYDPKAPRNKVRIMFAAGGGAAIAGLEGFALEKFAWKFEYDGAWKLDGSLTAKIAGNNLDLQASVHVAENEESFTCQLATDLLRIPDLFSLQARPLSFQVTRKRGGGRDERQWRITGQGSLRLDNPFGNGPVEVGGKLEIGDLGERKRGLRLVLEGDPLRFDLPLAPGVLWKFRLALDFLMIAHQPGAGWQLKVNSKLGLTGLPAILQSRVPDNWNVGLTADRRGLRLTVDPLFVPIGIDLPKIPIGQFGDLPLGRLLLGAGNLELVLGKAISLGVDLGLGIPPELNRILGVKEDGRTPAVELLHCYDPADPEPNVRLHLAVGTDGLSMRFRDSLFKALKLEERNNQTWCVLDFGDFGNAQFMLPIFKVDAKSGSLKAEVAFSFKDLKLPLTPLKALLRQAGAGGAADLFPDALPIMNLDFFDEANGELRVEPLITFLNDLLRSLGLDPLPQEITAPLRALAQVARRIPDALKLDYLNFRIPTEIKAAFSITGDGGVNIEITTPEEEPRRPLRLLLPGMVGPIPTLQGITLKGFSFGTVLSGSLFSLKVDAVYDQFDLLSLAAGIMIPDNELLPKPAEVHRRLIVNNLLALVIYQTKIPIPVPIFYDELGIQSLGIEGVQLQAHARFPMPKPNLLELAKMFLALRRFVTQPDYRIPLDPDMKLTRIQVGSAEHIWGAGTDGKIYRYDKNKLPPWIREEGAPTDVSVGADGSVWGSRKDGSIWRCDDGNWVRIEGAASTLAVGSAQHVWGLDPGGRVLRRAQDGWQVVGGLAPDRIAVGADGTVWAVTHGDEGAHRWTGSGWERDAGVRLLELAVGSGQQIIGLNRRGALFRRTGTTWEPFAGLPSPDVAAAIAVGHDGTCWALSQTQDVWRLDGGTWQKAGRQQDTLPDDLELKFHLHNVYLRLPKYFGSKLIGHEGSLAEVRLIRTIATLMNAVKFFSLDDLISLLPLELRVQNHEITFFFLKLEAQALLTTPREFREGAFELLRATPDQVRAFLDVLPATRPGSSPAEGHENGLVLFMRSRWALANLAHLEVVFGLAASGALGFQTGFRIAGRVAEIIDLEFAGRVAVRAPAVGEGTLPLRAAEGVATFGGPDRVLIADHPAYRLDAVTIELWILRDQPGSEVAFLISKGHEQFEIHLGAPNPDGVRFIPTPSVYLDTPQGVLPAQGWIHIACVYDPKNRIGRIYVQGMDTGAVASGTNPVGTALVHSIIDWHVGMRAEGTYGFKGRMAELRLWREGRTTQQIRTGMHHAVDAGDPGLVGYWPLTESTGRFRDITPASNHGARHGVTTLQWRPSPPLPIPPFACNVLAFSGVQSYATAKHTAAYTEVTISLWFRWSGRGEKNQFLVSCGLERFEIHLFDAGGDNRIRFIPTPGIYLDSPPQVFTRGNWVQIACVYGPTVARMVVDGTDLGLTQNGGPLQPASADLYFGARADKSHFFAGELAEVRFWSRALTLEEIRARRLQRLGGGEANLQGYWPLDEETGETAVDRSPGANAAQLQGAGWRRRRQSPPLPVPPYRRGSIRTVGGTYAEAAVRDAAAVTIELWFCWNGAEHGTLFLVSKAIEVLEIHLQQAGSANQIRFIPTRQVYLDTGAGMFRKDRWVHLACVYDPGRAHAKIFVDGREIPISNAGKNPLTQPIAPATTPLRLGLRSESGLYPFSGRIAEVRIWDRARTEAEIRETLYQRPGAGLPGLIGCWGFDDGAGTTALNRAADGPPAALCTAAWHSLPPVELPPHALFRVSGRSHLRLFGHQVFRGSIDVSDHGFELDGMVSLFPEGWPLQVNGLVMGTLEEKGLVLFGRAEARLGLIILARARILILAHAEHSRRGAWVDAFFLGQSVHLAIEDGETEIHATFRAEFGQLATVDALVKVDKVQARGTVDVAIEILRLGVLRIHGQGGNGSGSLEMKYGNHVLLEGTGESRDDEFILNATFQLLPDNTNFNVTAELDGHFKPDAFVVKGQIQVIRGMGELLAGGDAWVSQRGIFLELNFLKLGRATVQAIDAGDRFNIDLAAAAGPLGLTARIWILKNGNQGGGTITGRIDALAFDASITALGDRFNGHFGIRLLDIELFRGTSRARLERRSDGFTITGDAELRLPPAGSPRLLSLAARDWRGGLTGQNISFSGQTQVWIGLDLGLVKVGLTGGGGMSLNHAGLTTNLWIQGLLELPIIGRVTLPRVDIHSSFRIWKGRKCFMAAWIFPLPWPLGHLNKHRLVLYEDVHGSFFNGFWETWGNDGWPTDLRPHALAAEAVATDATPVPHVAPLALLEAILAGGETAGEDEKQQFCLALAAHQVGFHLVEEGCFELRLWPASREPSLGSELAAVVPELRGIDLTGAELVFRLTVGGGRMRGSLSLMRPGKAPIEVDHLAGQIEKTIKLLAQELIRSG